MGSGRGSWGMAMVELVMVMAMVDRHWKRDGEEKGGVDGPPTTTLVNEKGQRNYAYLFI